MPKGLLAPSLIPGWVLPHEIETLDGIFRSSPGWCISCIICQRRYTSFDLIYCTYWTLCKYCSVLSPQYAAIEFNSSLGPENLCREFKYYLVINMSNTIVKIILFIRYFPFFSLFRLLKIIIAVFLTKEPYTSTDESKFFPNTCILI